MQQFLPCLLRQVGRTGAFGPFRGPLQPALILQRTGKSASEAKLRREAEIDVGSGDPEWGVGEQGLYQ